MNPHKIVIREVECDGRLQIRKLFRVVCIMAKKKKNLAAARQSGGGQDQHSGCAERPKRAALPPQRDQRDVRLTRGGRRARLSGEGEAQNGNSGLRLLAKGYGLRTNEW